MYLDHYRVRLALSPSDQGLRPEIGHYVVDEELLLVKLNYISQIRYTLINGSKIRYEYVNLLDEDTNSKTETNRRFNQTRYLCQSFLYVISMSKTQCSTSGNMY